MKFDNSCQLPVDNCQLWQQIAKWNNFLIFVVKIKFQRYYFN